MEKSRKKYERPCISRVRLMVEEIVLTFCKGPGFKGPGVSACRTSGSPQPCQVRGT